MRRLRVVLGSSNTTGSACLRELSLPARVATRWSSGRPRSPRSQPGRPTNTCGMSDAGSVTMTNVAGRLFSIPNSLRRTRTAPTARATRSALTTARRRVVTTMSASPVRAWGSTSSPSSPSPLDQGVVCLVPHVGASSQSGHCLQSVGSFVLHGRVLLTAEVAGVLTAGH